MDRANDPGKAMSAVQFHDLFAIAFGFAVAGLIASAYQCVTERPPSFRLLNRGPRPAAFAAIPLIAFAAPFIIMRNTIRGCRLEDRNFSLAMVATVIAGCWSLASGSLVVMALNACGLPAG